MPYAVTGHNQMKKPESKDSGDEHMQYIDSSFIQTILSASELHRIMPYGSRAVPPVGNHTLPRRTVLITDIVLAEKKKCKGKIFKLMIDK